MSKSFVVLSILLLTFLQISLPIKLFGISANFLIAALVTLVFISDFYLLLWIGLFAGLILDLNTGIDFGLNMIFFVLLALVLKMIIKKGEISAKLVYIIIFTAISTVCYNLLLYATIFAKISNFNVLNLASNLLIEILLNVILAIIFYFMFGFAIDRLDKLGNTSNLRYK